MSKLITGFVVCFILLALSQAIQLGGGGILANSLLTALTKTDNVSINIGDTTGWMGSGVVYIDSEEIYYATTNSTHLQSLIRGFEGTRNSGHSVSATVYSESAAAINQAMGFNAAALAVSGGWYNAVVIPALFLTVTIPHMIISGNSFFQGDFGIMAYVWLALGLGIYVVLAISIGTAVAYALRR